MIKRILFLLLAGLLITSNCFAANVSNADIDDEDMADISDWTDNDSGTGASTQVTFDSKSCMKLDTGGTIGGMAQRQQDIGTFGARSVISLNLYLDTLGSWASNNYFLLNIYEGSTLLQIGFCSDGLLINTGAGMVEAGTDIVIVDTWQEWTFDVNWTAETVDVYLGQVLQASGLDCSTGSAVANGTVNFNQYSDTTANRLSYVDWFKAGSDFTIEVAVLGQVIFIE